MPKIPKNRYNQKQKLWNLDSIFDYYLRVDLKACMAIYQKNFACE
ncbi:hypothetical protein HFN_1577 [Helicobacter fennelliae MRY12-0050]|uniref:Uncharacterized protein n=1 Tax=Helicobacter fennelliae MRY12-0050 TaxID=1325130 RepID=T1DUM7_9HELI|nr:hypothetical protein HFN_1577 [Helicobacter fennelliae MRY12-0050]